MVPPDSLLQELTVPNLQIARGIYCVVFVGYVSSAAFEAEGIQASDPAALGSDLIQATAP
jgi:hypothetical protein